MVGAQAPVSIFMLLRQNLNRGEEIAQAGTLQLVGLLVQVAFRDHDAALPRGKFGKRLAYASQQFDLLFRDRIREAHNPLMFLLGDRRCGQLLKAIDQ